MATKTTKAGATTVWVAVSRMTYPLRTAQRNVRQTPKGRIRFTRRRDQACATTA